MRIHLVTVEGAEQVDDYWEIAPLVPLSSLGQHGTGLMMPMAGDDLELLLPDGNTKSAHIASFGVSVWKDSEGNLFMDTDPADPYLSLSIMCDSDVGEVPAGTEIWLSEAKFSSAPPDS
jgi:hypothetical protein